MDKEGYAMSEEKDKNSRLLAYWLFSTTVIVFGAITAYIALWARPLGASMWDVVWAGRYVWGLTAVAAVIIYIGYTYYNKSKA